LTLGFGHAHGPISKPRIDAQEITFNILIAGYAQSTGSTAGFDVIFNMINVV
jgi:hypothetical protein